MNDIIKLKRFEKSFLAVIVILGIAASGCSVQAPNTAATPTTLSPSPLNQSSGSIVLTTENAQKAIDRWADTARSSVCREEGEVCSVQVKGGVREIPQDNSAVAEITFSEFIYKLKNENNDRIYSGNGKAYFVKYTDGRWSLKEIKIGDMYGAVTWKPDIDVR